MTLFFPDVNLWIALSVEGHSHGGEAWTWLRSLSSDAKLLFSRYTQLGLLRLLTSQAVMADRALIMHEAWDVYDTWLLDDRVQFCHESPAFEATFREVCSPLGARQASKWIGDCYLLAYAKHHNAELVTFDQALYLSAKKQGYSASIPR